MTAAAAVLGTYELLEQILLHVPLRTALLAQRVNKSFQNVIFRSQSLRQALFLQPAEGEPLRYQFTLDTLSRSQWQDELSGKSIVPIINPFLELWRSDQAATNASKFLPNICFTLRDDYKLLDISSKSELSRLPRTVLRRPLLISQPPSCTNDIAIHTFARSKDPAKSAYYLDGSADLNGKRRARSRHPQYGVTLTDLLSTLLAEEGSGNYGHDFSLYGLTHMRRPPRTVDEITGLEILGLIQEVQAGTCLDTIEAVLIQNRSAKSLMMEAVLADLGYSNPSRGLRCREYKNPPQRSAFKFKVILSSSRPLLNEENKIATLKAIKQRIEQPEVEQAASKNTRHEKMRKLRVHDLK